MGMAAGLFSPAGAAGAQTVERRPSAFAPEQVVLMAQALAQSPYVAPWRVGAAAAALDYDGYRRLIFRRERQLWRDAGLRFTADWLPAGYLFPQPIALYEVADGVARIIPFAPEDYDAPPELASALAANGFSGVRLQYPINKPDKFDEIAVFQGASYFRSLGRDEVYGLSARGLAIGVGSSPEEFPAFRTFWIERPAPGAGQVVVHALLDSPSVSGAYRFVIRPGDRTTFDVEATLFTRRELDQVGVAPQSSMFLHGSADRVRYEDFRDAVHDSDGLAIETANGGRLWRPLTNPSRLQDSAFSGATPRGFGLMQRARRFEDFGDLEARYDLRPSLWVEPLNDWGEGAVRLVELPTNNEAMDNIVAFWSPAKPLRPGVAHRFAYRLNWGAEPPGQGLARVARTRAGAAVPPARARQFAIDFADVGSLDGVRADVSATAGKIGSITLSPHPSPGSARAAFQYEPPAGGTAELELRLVNDAGARSETWRFRWTG